MVDSRAKGQRGEYQVRDLFRQYTGLEWERVPGSGGFGKQHFLKGDIYVPGVDTKYCVEIKTYGEDVINSNLLNTSVSQLEKFWQQTSREAEQVGKEPILVFKKDRGKWLVASTDWIIIDEADQFFSFKGTSIVTINIMLLEDWLKLGLEMVK